MTNQTDTPAIRVLLADDDVLMRSGLRMLLEASQGIEIVGEAGDGLEAVAMAEALRPDVVLHVAAYTDVTGAERDPPACWRANVLGTRHVADGCAALGWAVFHPRCPVAGLRLARHRRRREELDRRGAREGSALDQTPDAGALPASESRPRPHSGASGAGALCRRGRSADRGAQGQGQRCCQKGRAGQAGEESQDNPGAARQTGKCSNGQQLQDEIRLHCSNSLCFTLHSGGP